MKERIYPQGSFTIHPEKLWREAYNWADTFTPELADVWRRLVRHSHYHLASEPLPSNRRVSALGAFKIWLLRFKRRFPGLEELGNSKAGDATIDWDGPADPFPEPRDEAEATVPSLEEFIPIVKLWRYVLRISLL